MNEEEEEDGGRAEDEEEEGVPVGNGPCDPRGRRTADGSGDELKKGKK